MLLLSAQDRRRLWKCDDWSHVLNSMALDLLENSASSGELSELASLCEAIVPDPLVAMELYCRAYTSGAEEKWGERAAALALQAGDFASLARIADLRHGYTGNPEFLRSKALGLLDAGLTEAAVAPLRLALDVAPDDLGLRTLALAASRDYQAGSDAVRVLESLAKDCEVERESAVHLLTAARISRLLPDDDNFEQLLMRAFDANPSEATVCALLENRWIESHQWKRLSNLYRIRTERSTSRIAEVESYRLAGTRLILGSEGQGIGVRLLQQAVTIVYRDELEAVPQLVAMLGLLSDVLVDSGGTPSAIRLLATALAHPRTDDEAIWIVNRGLKLAEGDVALRRTVTNLNSLREALWANEPALLKDEAAAEIGEEVGERESPPGLSPEVADRAFVAADVNIAVRAEISTRDGNALAMTRDMSETGLFIASSVVLSLRDEIELTILMPGEDDWSLTEHELSGVIARVVPGVGYGVRLTEVPDQYVSDIRALCASS